jgi:hypothetical protein
VRLARLRAQLLELCERLLHEQECDLAPQLRQLLLQALDPPSLRLACARWMQPWCARGRTPHPLPAHPAGGAAGTAADG